MSCNFRIGYLIKIITLIIIFFINLACEPWRYFFDICCKVSRQRFVFAFFPSHILLQSIFVNTNFCWAFTINFPRSISPFITKELWYERINCVAGFRFSFRCRGPIRFSQFVLRRRLVRGLRRGGRALVFSTHVIFQGDGDLILVKARQRAIGEFVTRRDG